MAVAKQLAPTERHTLRSAVRMELHLQDEEAAHRLLKRSDATPHDPWLAAAEIAVATHREKSPTFFKVGQAILDSGNWLPHQVSELAAALGTTVIIDGKHKRGRRFIQQGLADPTGNTLAQAEWINTTFHERFLVSSTLRNSADAHEARGRDALGLVCLPRRLRRQFFGSKRNLSLRGHMGLQLRLRVFLKTIRARLNSQKRH
ncbi:MAG: hypothetical protein H6924_07520 [Alphaproteobacteria bacterium]|nr:hypothetical protein [Alphaproteobacteria bacterium]